MKHFTEGDLSLTFINVVCSVPPGSGKKYHTDRPYHGFAFYPGESSNVFCFDNGKSYAVGNGSLIYLPKHSTYYVEKPGKSTLCYAINFDILEELCAEPFVIRLKNSSHTEDAFIHAEKIWETKATGYYAKCRSFFYDLIYTLQKENASAYIPNEKKEKLSKAVSYIGEVYLHEDISIEKLSRLCGMSSAYFRRLFGEVYGTSPVKYINSLKISHAKELILSDLYSISEIAQLSGFSDECYFCKVFKKETSYSPKEYKRILRK